MFDLLAPMLAGLAIFMPAGADVEPCSSVTVALNVTCTDDVQNLSDALACSGAGVFDITWSTSLTITQTIEVSNNKEVKVTGFEFPRIRGGLTDYNVTDTMVETGAGNGTSLFSVSNDSTLRLNNLVLEGGNAEFGGAVNLLSSSSLFLIGCALENNNASMGGAISASTSAIYIAGNTSFDYNSAADGGAISASTSAIYIAGNTSFDYNSAADGGALSLIDNSFLQGEDIIRFLNNSANQDGGAVRVSDNSSVDLHGDISFNGNSAERHGGALFVVDDSSVDLHGDIVFNSNSAGRDGAVKIDPEGALFASVDCSIDLHGEIGFNGNSAGDDGGAVFVGRESFIDINGNSKFYNNIANTDGGCIHLWINASANVIGNSSFAMNIAKQIGGVLFATDDSVMVVEGDSVFDTNLAGMDGGAISLRQRSRFQIVGRTSMIDNFAESDGGAIYAIGSSIHIDGVSNLYNNSAINDGGAISLARASVLMIDGNTSFSSNSAGISGGVIHASASSVHIYGSTSVTHNSANSPGGGFLYAIQTEVIINGSTYVARNSGYDGGAILAQQSDIYITGNAVFAYNAADRDGGGMKTTDTTVTIGTIVPGAGLSPTSALPRDITESISFVANTAFSFGGAIAMANPIAINVSDSVFISNKAESGGAVSVTSTDRGASGFERCRFMSNSGTRGGALFFNGDGQRFLQESSLRLNVADETGGAIFNIGALEIHKTVFAENMATDGGLAINNLEPTSDVVLCDVTFDDNVLGCPVQTYSSTKYSSIDTCRFELACSKCLLDGCESDLSNVTIGAEAIPTCEPIPEGVSPPTKPITLQSFNLEEGYYRVSTESAIVLECYQKDACTGGVDPSDYCAVGYSGPYCSVCTEGYAPGSSGRCHECSGENTGFAVIFSTTVMFIAVLVVVLVVSYLVQRVGDGHHGTRTQPRCFWHCDVSRFRSVVVDAMPFSAIRIVVVVLQIITQFTEIAGTVYPEEYERFLSAMALINFEIGSILSTSCLFRTDFYDRLLLATLGPLAISIACVATFLIAKKRNGRSNTAGLIVKHKHLSIVLFMVFFVYSSVSFTIFQAFVCDSLDDDNAYLRADYSIICYTNTHNAYLIYASLMVCVYPVGVPALFALWLVSHRQELKQPNRETESALKPYRCLWAAYKPSCYYFEVVECGRRIMLTGAAVFILPDKAEQVAVVLFIAVVFVFISESISPFASEVDMWIYRWGNGIILASMYLALLLKADLAEEGNKDSDAITLVLIAANVFMVFTLAVQSIFLLRGTCASFGIEQIGPATHQREEQDGFGVGSRPSTNM